MYRIYSGGTMTVTEGNRATHYEVGHEIELSESEAARLNENRPPGQWRVVRMDGELAAQTPKLIHPPRSAEARASELGVQSVDELRGAGLIPGEDAVALIDQAVRSSAERMKLVSEQPELLDQMRRTTPIDPAEIDPAESDLKVVVDTDVAPDWPTYLASVDARTAAEAIRGLESADDVQAAMDAESGPGGLQRPLVIRAGNAATRRLRKG